MTTQRASWTYGSGVANLDDAEGVVDGSLHLVAVEVVGPAQDYRSGSSSLEINKCKSIIFF